MVETVKKMFAYSFKKEWYKTYWAFDIHGVIFKPNYNKDLLEAEFYPFAKETLQLLTKRDDIVLIMFTSSYPNEIEFYQKVFKENNINFKYINENPEIKTSESFGYYESKWYFNLLFEDKAGFDAAEDWSRIYYYIMWCNDVKYLPDPNWGTKH